MRLVLIDSRIDDITGISGSLTENTEYILFDYLTDTIASIRDKITNTYESVAIIQHNYKLPTYQLVSSSEVSKVVGLVTEDPNLETWKEYIGFLVWLKTEKGAEIIDLMACDLWADENWKYMIETVRARDGVYIRASIDRTGEGGNFVLESDGIDMVGVYFTEKILEYKYAFYINSYWREGTVADSQPLLLPYSNPGTISSTLFPWAAPTTIAEQTVVYGAAHFASYAFILQNKSVVALTNHGSFRAPTASQQLKLVNVKTIVSTEYAFAALKEDGTVVCWGNGGSAYNIDITTNTSSTIPFTAAFEATVTNIISLKASMFAFAALSSTGKIYVWGATSHGANLSTTTITGMTRIENTSNGFYAWNTSGVCYYWSTSETVLTQLTGTVIDVIKGLSHSQTLYLRQVGGNMVITKIDGTEIHTLPAGVVILKYVMRESTPTTLILLSNRTLVQFTHSTSTKIIHDDTIDVATTRQAYALIKGNAIDASGAVAYGGVLTDSQYGLPLDGSTVVSITNPIKLFSTQFTFGVLTQGGKFYIWGVMSNLAPGGGLSTNFINNFSATNNTINSSSNIIHVYDTIDRFTLIKSDGTYIAISFVNQLFTGGGYMRSYTKTTNTNLGILTAQTFFTGNVSLALLPVSVPNAPRVESPGFIIANKSSTVSYYISNPERMAYAGRIYRLYTDTTTLLATFIPTTNTLTYTFSNVTFSTAGKYTLTITDYTNTAAETTVATFTLPVYNYDYLYSVAGTVNTSGSITPITLNSATFNRPGEIAFDSINNMYIADTNNHVIRVVPAQNGTLYGVNVIVGNTYVVAGTGTFGTNIANGTSNLSCTLNSPYGVAFDSNDNMFISDTNNHVVRVISKAGGSIYGVTTTANQSFVVAGTGTAGSGFTTTVSNQISFPVNATESNTAFPDNITTTAITDDGNRLFISRTSITSGEKFQYYTRSSDGNWINSVPLIMPFDNNNGRYIDVTPDGKRVVVTLYDGYCYFADANDVSYNQFRQTLETTTRGYNGISITADGNRIVTSIDNVIAYADWNGENYGEFIPTLQVTNGRAVVSRDGSRIAFKNSFGDPATQSIQIMFWDTGSNSYGNTRSTLDTLNKNKNVDHALFSPDGKTLFIAINSSNYSNVYAFYYSFWNGTTYGEFTYVGNSLPSNSGTNMAISFSDTPIVYFKLSNSSKFYTLPFTMTNNASSSGFNNRLKYPKGITVDSVNNLYIADSGNHAIKVISGTGGFINGIATYQNYAYTIIGTEGTSGSSANNVDLSGSLLNSPSDIVFDSSRNMFVSDTSSNVVRVVSKVNGTIFNKTVSLNKLFIVAGNPAVTSTSGVGSGILVSDSTVQLFSPRGLAVDENRHLFISDSGSHSIRVISNKTGTIGTTSTTKNFIYTSIIVPRKVCIFPIQVHTPFAKLFIIKC